MDNQKVEALLIQVIEQTNKTVNQILMPFGPWIAVLLGGACLAILAFVATMLWWHAILPA